MLKELYLKYKDGRVEKSIIFVESDSKLSSSHPSDDLIISRSKTFRYKVVKHNYLSTSIVKFLDKYMIMPQGIVCHPETTLKDIVEIKRHYHPLPNQYQKPNPADPKTWTFQSSSGGGDYIVKMTSNGFSCSCPGFFRSKGNCKHVKEVANY